MVARNLKASLLVAAASAALAFAASHAEAQSAQPDVASSASSAGTAVKEVVITAQRLDKARESIQPDTGASTYTVTHDAIQLIPGGDNAGLNQIVLQMPGVVQDSYGQLHVRGDHANIQYRFNGVILPEGLSFFGQVISPRIADSIKLITGALPAEYGLRTAGILDIRTKSGFENGGQVGVYGGSHGEWEPSIEYGGTVGNNSFFGSASYMQNQVGVESPDGSSTPHHDRTTQEQAFGYFDHIIDSNSRVSVFAGVSAQDFQIPDLVGNQPSNGYQYNGKTAYPSESLNANQRELNTFAAGSYLYSTGDFTGQVSLYARYSSLEYSPDVAGELLYNGFAQYARKEDIAAGLQAEGAYKLGDRHTLRAGLIFENDRSNSATTAQVFTLDATGNPILDANNNNVAQTVVDNGSANAQTYSVYLQDEWKIFDNFVLNYGLRFDQLVSFRRENQLSPRINFVWTPLPGTTVHGGYARYFTPPPFELVANTSIQKFTNTVYYPAFPVDTTPYAERDNYYDLGIQQKVTRHFTIGLDAYDRSARNLIDEGQFGSAIILTPYNYRYGRLYGAELTTSYEQGPFSAYWNLAYSHDRGKSIESSQFDFAPDKLAFINNNYIFLDHEELFSSSFGASYKWRDTRVSMDGIYGSGLRATGDNGVPNGVSLPTYTVFNLSLLQRINFLPGGPLDVRFDVVNLFDKEYAIRDGTGVGVGAPQWGARRGFFAGVSKKF